MPNPDHPTWEVVCVGCNSQSTQQFSIYKWDVIKGLSTLHIWCEICEDTNVVSWELLEEDTKFNLANGRFQQKMISKEEFLQIVSNLHKDIDYVAKYTMGSKDDVYHPPRSLHSLFLLFGNDFGREIWNTLK
jgi:hypothetical protein